MINDLVQGVWRKVGRSPQTGEESQAEKTFETAESNAQPTGTITFRDSLTRTS